MKSVGSVRTCLPTPKAVVTTSSASAAPTVIATLGNSLIIRPTAGYASLNRSQREPWRRDGSFRADEPNAKRCGDPRNTPLRNARGVAAGFVLLVRPWCDPSLASHPQGPELTIERESLAARDRHRAQERIRAGVTRDRDPSDRLRRDERDACVRVARPPRTGRARGRGRRRAHRPLASRAASASRRLDALVPSRSHPYCRIRLLSGTARARSATRVGRFEQAARTLGLSIWRIVWGASKRSTPPGTRFST